MTDHRRKEGIPLCQHLMQRVFFDDTDGLLMDAVRRLVLKTEKPSLEAYDLLSRATAALLTDDIHQGVQHIGSLVNFIRLSEGAPWVDLVSNDSLRVALNVLALENPRIESYLNLFAVGSGNPQKLLEVLISVSWKSALAFYKQQRSSLAPPEDVNVNASTLLALLDVVSGNVAQGEMHSDLLRSLKHGESTDNERLAEVERENVVLNNRLVQLLKETTDLQAENSELLAENLDLQTETEILRVAGIEKERLQNERHERAVSALKADTENWRLLVVQKENEHSEQQKRDEVLRVKLSARLEAVEGTAQFETTRRVALENQNQAVTARLGEANAHISSLETELKVSKETQQDALKKIADLERQCVGLQTNIRQRERAESDLAEANKELEIFRKRNQVPKPTPHFTASSQATSSTPRSSKAVKNPVLKDSGNALPDDQFSAFFKYIAKHPAPSG